MTQHIGASRALAALLGAGLLVASVVPSHAAKAYSAFYVFGDSLSDAGNVFNRSGRQVPPPPYVGGHFSDGPTWAEDLAQKLQLGPLTPSTKGGTDYAYGYATAAPGKPLGDAPPLKFSVPSVGEQVTDYLGHHGSKADPSALYAVWIGSNDILDAFQGYAEGQIPFDQIAPAIGNGLAAELTAIGALVQTGADHILVGSIPDLGLTPALNTNPVFAGLATQAAKDYNQVLMDAVMYGFPGADVRYLDTFALVDDAVAHPGRYGFTDVRTACFPDPATGTVCAEPDQHLFWDSVHPTSVGHEDIAALAVGTLGIAAVPLPGSAAMAGAALLGLAGLSFAARRRRAFGKSRRVRPSVDCA